MVPSFIPHYNEVSMIAMKLYRVALSILFCCVVTAAHPVSAENRTLYWQDFSVKAHLDGNGQLHIQEEQQIVFNGN